VPRLPEAAPAAEPLPPGERPDAAAALPLRGEAVPRGAAAVLRPRGEAVPRGAAAVLPLHGEALPGAGASPQRSAAGSLAAAPLARVAPCLDCRRERPRRVARPRPGAGRPVLARWPAAARSAA
jgi:hypothetical protein